METYSLLRHFADSWVLLALVAVFVGVVIWAFRPGSRRVQDEAARSIFQHDTAPAPDPEAKAPSPHRLKEPPK